MHPQESYKRWSRARLAAEAQAAADKETKRLEATCCPGCDRREDEYDYKRGASDGTELCYDCQKEADDARERNELLAARTANAAMHPCYTCQGSIGGKPDSIAELHKPADPYRLECPDCDYKRHSTGPPGRQRPKRPTPNTGRPSGARYGQWDAARTARQILPEPRNPAPR
ncbi:hypothetical protein ABZW30_42325 [Kitasatospora sp. NPDC004669]|uniref:hypothetical protein n=1 Tax=Kitasatospora sp. NPDC004669 TaxID=3154555 RepID=UPI0033B93367